MKKINIRNIIIIFIMLISLIYQPPGGFCSYALDTRIAFSDPSTTLGSTFDITMKVTSLDSGTLGSGNIMLNYDSSYIEFIKGDNAEGGAGSVKVTGLTNGDGKSWNYKLTFRALKAGTTKITISTWEIYDNNAKAATVSKEGSSTITIGAGDGVSTDAHLSSLKISPGVLAPTFSTDTFEYTAEVGMDIDKIAVSAQTLSEDAKVVISGNGELVQGENIIECKVTAADGQSTQIYTIKVNKTDSQISTANTGDSNVELDGSVYDIATDWGDATLPSGFIQTTATYNGIEYPAGFNQSLGLTVMYLTSQDGNGDFYTYDSTSNEWAPYAQIIVASKTVTIVPLPSDVALPAGFKETTVELNGRKVQGWVWASDTIAQYCIIYGQNSSGEKNFYRYDMAENEKTIQRYFSDPAIEDDNLTESYNQVLASYNGLLAKYNKHNLYLMISVVVAIAIFITLIVILVSRKDNKNANSNNKKKEQRRYDYTKSESSDEDKEELTKEEQYLRGQEVDFEDDIKSDTKIKKQQQKIKLDLAKQVQEIEAMQGKKNNDIDVDDDIEDNDNDNDIKRDDKISGGFETLDL